MPAVVPVPAPATTAIGSVGGDTLLFGNSFAPTARHQTPQHSRTVNTALRSVPATAPPASGIDSKYGSGSDDASAAAANAAAASTAAATNATAFGRPLLSIQHQTRTNAHELAGLKVQLNAITSERDSLLKLQSQSTANDARNGPAAAASAIERKQKKKKSHRLRMDDIAPAPTVPKSDSDGLGSADDEVRREVDQLSQNLIAIGHNPYT